MTESLGEAFPKMQARIRKLLGYGKEIGPAGAFYVMVCEQALREADEAAVSGDVVAMLRAYEKMKEIKA